MATDWVQIGAGALGTALAGALGVFGVHLSTKRAAGPARVAAEAAMVTADAARMTAEANMSDLMRKVFGDMLDDLREEVHRLNTEVGSLSGAVRNLTQHVESLEALLRRHGIPVPARPFIVSSNDDPRRQATITE